jgi:hypothetical protein
VKNLIFRNLKLYYTTISLENSNNKIKKYLGWLAVVENNISITSLYEVLTQKMGYPCTSNPKIYVVDLKKR